MYKEIYDDDLLDIIHSSIVYQAANTAMVLNSASKAIKLASLLVQY